MFPTSEEVARRCAEARAALADRLHDYVPGEHRRPMHTDPLCHDCGEPKWTSIHV